MAAEMQLVSRPSGEVIAVDQRSLSVAYHYTTDHRAVQAAADTMQAALAKMERVCRAAIESNEDMALSVVENNHRQFKEMKDVIGAFLSALQEAAKENRDRELMGQIQLWKVIALLPPDKLLEAARTILSGLEESRRALQEARRMEEERQLALAVQRRVAEGHRIREIGCMQEQVGQVSIELSRAKNKLDRCFWIICGLSVAPCVVKPQVILISLLVVIAAAFVLDPLEKHVASKQRRAVTLYEAFDRMKVDADLTLRMAARRTSDHLESEEKRAFLSRLPDQTTANTDVIQDLALRCSIL